MPVLPQLKSMFDAQRSAPSMATDLQPEQLREAMHAMIEQSFFALAAPQEPLPTEKDFVVPIEGGVIAIRLYRNDAGEGVLPCHVYYHGGGFFLGTLEHSDGYCRALARAADCAVISVDYRLAPDEVRQTYLL